MPIKYSVQFTPTGLYDHRDYMTIAQHCDESRIALCGQVAEIPLSDQN
jgi:hypothetical protein